MRTVFSAVFLLCATSAFCQFAPSTPNEPAPIQIFGHPSHASRVEMAMPQIVLQDTSYCHAKGERPLSDLALTSRVEISLGEEARRLRKEKDALTAKKSDTVWVN
jgi:hypothetical protein